MRLQNWINFGCIMVLFALMHFGLYLLFIILLVPTLWSVLFDCADSVFRRTKKSSWLNLPKFRNRAKLRQFEQELADAFLQRGKLCGSNSIAFVKENEYYYRWTHKESKESLHITYKLGKAGAITDALHSQHNSRELEISNNMRDYLIGVYDALEKSEVIQTEFKIMCSLRGLSGDYVHIRYMYRGSSEWIETLARKENVADTECWFNEDDILINWHPSISVESGRKS